MSAPPGEQRPRRPRLALPFTVLTAPGVVRLVCGEDFRYTLEAPGLEAWLPGLLAALDGTRTLDEATGALDAALRAPARDLVERLAGERVLVDGEARHAHRPAACRLEPEGSGPVLELLRARRGDGPANGPAGALPVLCQDRLDPAAALAFARRCVRAGLPHLWVTHGPHGRGFVGPALLPDAGPCLGCLLARFRRLSPAPEVHDALLAHARAGGEVVPVDFPPEGVAVLAALVAWKARALLDPAPPPAVFRLHVLERDAFEVTTHRVPVDPECPDCAA